MSPMNCPCLVARATLETELSVTAEIAASVSADYYTGETTVTPATHPITLERAGRIVRENINILEIPYYAVSNQTGTTFIIGEKINDNQ